jgi:hypothetical protein
MRKEGSDEHDQDVRRPRRAEPRAARALHGGRRRRVRRALRRPPPRLQPADRRRDRVRGLRVAVRRRLRHRLRQQGRTDGADARRPRRARRRRGGDARDHAPDLVRHGCAGGRAGRPPGARPGAHGGLRAAARARAARRVAARHGRLGQPLRERDGGRAGSRLGRRTLRLARLRPQDRLGLPRARAGPPVRRPGARGRDGLAAGPVRGRLGARRLVRGGDGAGRRVRVRRPRRRGREGARDPRRGGGARGAQPPQLRVAGGALRPNLLGGAQGLHAGAPRAGGLRRRLDGRRFGDPRGRREPGRGRVAALDGPRRRSRDEPLAGGGPPAPPQAVGVHGPRLLADVRDRRGLPRPPGRAAPQGVGRGAGEARRRRLAGGAGRAAGAGHRARRRRRRRGAGGVQAPAGRPRCPRRTIRVKDTLRPPGVAMAGRDVHDPYKD